MNVNDINNIARGCEILKEIENSNGDLDANTISLIGLFTHRDYVLPITNKIGSLLLLALELNRYKAAAFILKSGITVVDSEEDIRKSFEQSTINYNEELINEKINKLKTKKDNSEGINKLYENTLNNYESYMYLKESLA